MKEIGWTDLIYPKEQASIQKALEKLQKKHKSKLKDASKNTTVKQTPKQTPKAKNDDDERKAEVFVTEVAEHEGDSGLPTEDQTQVQTPAEPVVIPDDLVYPASKYVTERSPSCIYLPSDQLMLRMLRASLFIDSPKELVYYIE